MAFSHVLPIASRGRAHGHGLIGNGGALSAEVGRTARSGGGPYVGVPAIQHGRSYPSHQSVESPADDRARWCKDWDRKMGEYETHANELVDAMKERHKDELTIFQENLLQKQQCPKV